MLLTPAYLGHSGLTRSSGARILSLAPDLTRDRVAFNAPLADPLRFREAISALHDVVINDLRFVPRDKTAYDQWKLNQRREEAQIRAAAYREARQEIEAKRNLPISKDLKQRYGAAKKTYWNARRGLNDWLRRNDPKLWRKLMPYDPVITVADDCVFFECFSADESSYGCLTADRGSCFGNTDDATLGTTNVDYSWDLYDHFQSLRSYRETRFAIDPAGFEVATTTDRDERPDAYREEKIDIPDGWLRGFMQLQSCMALPMRKVTLSVPCVYSLLATLKRRKARTSPRAIRFELEDGKAPRLVLEPWDTPIDSHGTTYHGPSQPRQEPIRVWGRRRLLVLARLLPLAEAVDVYLLGTGLPTFWVVRMGSMRFTLALSGWTTNDWTRGSAVDLLMPPAAASEAQVAAAAQALNTQRQASLPDLARTLNQSPGDTAAALNQLALRGQVIHDLGVGQYRWRQALPMALSDKELQPVHPERVGATVLVNANKVQLASAEPGPRGGILLLGKAENQDCELLLDTDGVVKKGKCKCSWHYKTGIRNGPCRHLQALRDVWQQANQTNPADTHGWYDRLSQWAGQ